MREKTGGLSSTKACGHLSILNSVRFPLCAPKAESEEGKDRRDAYSPDRVVSEPWESKSRNSLQPIMRSNLMSVPKRLMLRSPRLAIQGR
ncbi:UNVERIFIED_CONTAM: hypothetical protein Slati_4567600 [Sesamum latifolium]|uniref:Uncharacterized protein n=1 Tax=Sesamum latifolium TaxID=2727402 RepID=A0AAW2SG45_9LAMI